MGTLNIARYKKGIALHFGWTCKENSSALPRGVLIPNLPQENACFPRTWGTDSAIALPPNRSQLTLPQCDSEGHHNQERCKTHELTNHQLTTWFPNSHTRPHPPKQLAHARTFCPAILEGRCLTLADQWKSPTCCRRSGMTTTTLPAQTSLVATSS